MAQHGGDLVSYKGLFHGDFLDFSSNINPDGMPLSVKKALLTRLESLERYPDIQYRSLKKSVASYLGCESDQVIVGNGAMEIIDSFITHFEKIVICPPCFSEYEERAIIRGKKVLKIPYRFNGEFLVDEKTITENLDSKTLLIITNPNNPTAHTIDQEALLRLYNQVCNKKAFLLLDECFFEFASIVYNSISLFKQNGFQNVAIIRASTKFFALPGLRLGYACTNTNFAKELNSKQLSWSVNALAEIAGTVIFLENQYISLSKENNAKRRNQMVKALKQIPKVECFESNANFILLRLKQHSTKDLFLHCAKNGILVRNANDFFSHHPALKNYEWVRLAIKKTNHNAKLLSVLHKFFTS